MRFKHQLNIRSPFIRLQKGATMIEYALIVAAIAITIFFAATVLANRSSSILSNTAETIEDLGSQI